MAALFVSVLLAMPVSALASGITNASEDLRTGWYPSESAITPELVTGGTFGREWSVGVEGQVYAQPLLDGSTLLVATEQNMVYGLNPANGEQRWSTSLGTPWNPAEISCGDLAPSVGVTATPVIDTATNTAFVTHKTYVSGAVRWYMDAIDMSTGKEQPGFPVELSGNAQNAPGQRFEARDELQRPGLLLMEGVVYAGFGSDCDHTPFQGWVFGVTESGVVKARWTSETEENGGGIWQSGAGLTSDGPGTMLISTGNGETPIAPTLGTEPPGTLGESIVRLRVQANGELKATEFFAPYDANTLASWDADFASGGVTGLPHEYEGTKYFGTESIPDLAVAVGKDGYVYLLDRDKLGGIGEGPGGSDDVVQRLGPYGGVWSRPGVWPGEGGWVYIPTASNGETAGGSSGNLRVYSYGVSGTGAPTLSLQGTSAEAFGFSSGAPVITSTGTKSGSALVWVEWAPNGTGEGAQLRAYAPIPSKGEPRLLWSAPIGDSAKFATPGIGAGRLYVGTRDGHVIAFGSPVTPPLSSAPTEFPATTIGEHSTRTVTLRANEKLTITKLASSSSEFEMGSPSPALPATLSAGQSIEVPVTFAPTETGQRAATLTATTSTGSTVPFSLSGSGLAEGPKLEASPVVLTFGGTTVGGSISDAAVLRNVGGSTLTISGAKAPSAPFHAQGLPADGTQIAPGEHITVPVEFAPTATGSFESTLAIESNGGEAQVALTGSAALPGVLTIEPESLAYGVVLLGQTATRSFTVADTGGSGITIYKSKPPIGGEFAATTSLPEDTTISPGEALTESVSFTALSAGEASGVWLINGEGSTRVHEVLFAGIGSPAALARGEVLSSMTSSSPLVSGISSPTAAPRAVDALLLSRRLRTDGRGRVAVEIRCPISAGRCTGTIALRTAGTVAISPHGHGRTMLTLASGKLEIAGGHEQRVVLSLSKIARSLLARKRRLEVRVLLSTRDANGAKATAQLGAGLR